MDEAHNLVRSQMQYAEQLQRQGDAVRRLLFEAKNLVLAGFTGTPILSVTWRLTVKGGGWGDGDSQFFNVFFLFFHFKILFFFVFLGVID